MKTRFTNETEAKAYLLESLEKKYDKKFVVIGDERCHTVGLHDIYTYDVYAEGESVENLVNARVTDFGELTDDYIKYYYKEDVEKIAIDAIKDIDSIQSYTVELKTPYYKKCKIKASWLYANSTSWLLFLFFCSFSIACWGFASNFFKDHGKVVCTIKSAF